jgi:flavin-binding protein dodecin
MECGARYNNRVPGIQYQQVQVNQEEEEVMSDHVYKHIEITGSSDVGTDDAISNAVAKAGKTVKHMHWFEVTDTRGYIDDGDIKHWQVTIKIGFRLED